MDITPVATTRTAGLQSYAPAAATRPMAQNLPAPTAQVAKAAKQSAKEPDAATLQQAVDASNKVLANKTSNELHFAIEKGTGLSVVTLVNQKSGETILQFPSEAMLQIAKGIDQVTGAIIQRKA
ncbi:MAG: flagellar protein FlaG [Rhodoferax sp.]|uniref:flagellar protein FlaG n=1 Tax=Rhodoferax sp. TaxID=50421 RepID=UPI00261D1683|nr:flagellar protein FlaG [Rhodoferax sp.]MDD2880929.1 flagellar protein FlaG [Rhodoferax sp.]